MKRIAARILLFLLIGAMINVAVAWACSAWTRQTAQAAQIYFVPGKQVDGSPPPAELAALIPEAWLEHRSDVAGIWIHVDEVLGAGLTVRWIAVDTFIPYANKIGFDHTLLVLTAGLPARSFVSTIEEFPHHSEPKDALAIPSWLRPDKSDVLQLGRASRMFPTSPIPGGFVINTLFFALLFWLIWDGRTAARRCYRLHRGQCVGCGYPVGASPVCTECGEPVKPRSVPA